MARIEVGRSAFQAEREFSPNEPVRWTEVGEPWRVLKSSLAISFSSRRRRKWRPEALAPEVRSDIIRAIEARRTITVADTELRQVIRELVGAASALQHFRIGSPVWMQSNEELRKALKRIIWEAEPLAATRQELGVLLMRIDSIADELELLSSGYLEVRENWSRTISMRFSSRRSLTLTPAEVEAKAHRIRLFVDEATENLDRARETLVNRLRQEKRALRPISGEDAGTGAPS